MIPLGMFVCLTLALTITNVNFVVNAEDSPTLYSYGVMTLFRDENSIRQKDFCFTYPSEVYDLKLITSKNYTIINETGLHLCIESPNSDVDVSTNGNTLFVMKQDVNCSIRNYINHTLNNSGSVLMMVSSNLNPYKMKEGYNLDVLAVIKRQTLLDMSSWLNDSKLRFYSVKEDASGGFDGSMLVLWFAACFCVFLGAYFGPYRDLSIAQSEQEILDVSGNSHEAGNPLKLTVAVMLILVVFISATLLLLYFYYSYFVYFFIAIFCLASCRAVFDMLNQICRFFNLHKSVPKIKGILIHHIVIGAVAVALPITWFVLRHNRGMWVLQDILGVCFCINLIQILRLPNLKVCTTLLTLLFIYDIFFVFITPLFTSDGVSIMVEVATGGDSSEMLPLLLKFPHMQTGLSRLLSVCVSDGFSLLGFGDIIVPGFLVCFAHGFDIARGEKYRPYFITTFIGYAVGLAIAFVVLFISQTGQPALLYIVPSTLLPIYGAAIIKRQLRDIWEGSVNVVSAAQISD